MEDFVKQLEILSKNVDKLNDTFKNMLNENKYAYDSFKEEIITKHLYCDLKSKKENSSYFIYGNFILEKEFILPLNELIERKIDLGGIYGEYNPSDNFTLSRVSHIIDDIKINDIGLDMINVEFCCHVLNTHYGSRVRKLIDDGIEFSVKLSLKYLTAPKFKIFTLDIVTI